LKILAEVTGVASEIEKISNFVLKKSIFERKKIKFLSLLP